MAKEIEELVSKFRQVLGDFPEVKYAGDPILRESTQEVSVEDGIRIGKELGEILIKYRKTGNLQL